MFWLSQAYFALTPENRAPQAASGMITGMERGEPRWLAAMMRGAGSLVAHQGLATSIVLALALVLVAVGVCLPARAARATLLLAIVLAVVLWVFVQAFGGILATGATDPESGPLLALLALAYWPSAQSAAPGAVAAAECVASERVTALPVPVDPAEVPAVQAPAADAASADGVVAG